MSDQPTNNEEFLTGVVDPPTGEEVASEEAADEEPTDQPDPEPEPREAAVALGLLVPDDWSDDQVRDALAAFQAASDDADTPPPESTGRRRPASPRG